MTQIRFFSMHKSIPFFGMPLHQSNYRSTLCQEVSYLLQMRRTGVWAQLKKGRGIRCPLDMEGLRCNYVTALQPVPTWTKVPYQEAVVREKRIVRKLGPIRLAALLHHRNAVNE